MANFAVLLFHSLEPQMLLGVSVRVCTHMYTHSLKCRVRI